MTTSWCLSSFFLGAQKQKKNDDMRWFIVVFSRCIEIKEKKMMMSVGSSSSFLGAQKEKEKTTTSINSSLLS
jgi:hypothetical protein